MSFEYRTEYGLGRWGRVSRSYSGTQAVVAIAFDLALGFTFGVIGLGLRLVRCRAVKACRVALALVSLPSRVIRAVLAAHSRRAVAKPAWASLDEL